MRLNARTLERLAAGGAPAQHADDACPGMVVRVGKSGASYAVKADLWQDRRKVRTVRVTLGRVGELPLDDARDRARNLLRLIRRGIDPTARPATERRAMAPVPLREALEMHVERLEAGGRAEGTISERRRLLQQWLADWMDLPLGDITKSMCAERHADITARLQARRRDGRVVANQVMRCLRALYGDLARLDDAGSLGEAPTRGVRFHAERRRDAMILPEELPDWWRRVGELPNPIRRQMHRLGLLSGLRPGTLVRLERDWLDMDAALLRVPAEVMKSRRPLELPLSEPMLGIAREALKIGDVMHPGAPWLFPSRSNDGRRVQATQVWRERTMPSETGHLLRRTWRTMAAGLGCPDNVARALVAHRAPGIEAHYVSAAGMMDELRHWQARVSAHILKTAGAD